MLDLSALQDVRNPRSIESSDHPTRNVAQECEATIPPKQLPRIPKDECRQRKDLSEMSSFRTETFGHETLYPAVVGGWQPSLGQATEPRTRIGNQVLPEMNAQNGAIDVATRLPWPNSTEPARACQ